MRSKLVRSKLVKILFATVVAFVALCTQAATETVNGIEWNYTVEDGKAVIEKGMYSSAIPSPTAGAITIPSALGGYPVAGIGDYAFYNCRGLTSVTIPTGVTHIGSDAFYNCSGLTSVTIPTGVTHIGSDAFWYCSGLTSVTIPNSVASIGDYAFWYCSGLTSVTIPNSVASIGDCAFSHCGNLSEVIWQGDISSIEFGYDVFSSTQYELPFTLLIDEDNVLTGFIGTCPTNVVIPEGVVAIGESAFDADYNDVWRLQSVSIPSTVTNISVYAFYACESLESVTIAEGVEEIDVWAFYRNTSLTNIVIPSTVKRVGADAFGECVSLSDVKFKSEDTVFDATAFRVSVPVGEPNEFGGYNEWYETCATNLNPLVFEKVGYGLVGWRTKAVNGADPTWEATFGATDMTPFASTNYYGEWVYDEISDVEFWSWYDVIPVVAANRYSVVFDPNGGTGTMASQEFSYDEDGVLNSCTYNRSGYGFVGWALTPDSEDALYQDCASVKNLTVVDGGEVKLYAIWDRTSLWAPPSADGGSSAGDGTSGSASEAFSGAVAEVYDGYIFDGEVVIGTVQAKTAKAKPNKNMEGKATSKVAVTIQIAGEKKLTIKGDMSVEDAEFTAEAKDGRILKLGFGANGLFGEFDGYLIDGARNFFSSKDKGEKADAEDVLAPWLGVLNMKCGNGTLSIAVAKKGKVTVKGEIGGAKVSAKAQALIGEDTICIPVAYSKKGVNLAFTLWLPLDGGKVEVVGMDGNPIVGKAGTIKDGAIFAVEGNILADIPSAIAEIDGYALLPDGESVAASGTKWVVADGVKAAKVAYKKSVLSIAEGKKGEGIANPSQLKLTYKAKDGSFKGSFYVYTLENGKFKKQKATVTGVLIDGVGYGTATIKKLGSWNITIK